MLRVLEFRQARFGDHETRFISRAWKTIWLSCSMRAPAIPVMKIDLKWKPEASVCVVIASGCYPGNYEQGKVIKGLEDAAKLPGVKVAPCWHGHEGRANCYKWWTRAGRDGVRQRFKNRTSGCLCSGGKNLF